MIISINTAKLPQMKHS